MFIGSEGACKETEVRRYAIQRLQDAKEDELKMFLLQLVQALKYEHAQEQSSKKFSKNSLFLFIFKFFENAFLENARKFRSIFKNPSKLKNFSEFIKNFWEN